MAIESSPSDYSPAEFVELEKQAARWRHVRTYSALNWKHMVMEANARRISGDTMVDMEIMARKHRVNG